MERGNGTGKTPGSQRGRRENEKAAHRNDLGRLRYEQLAHVDERRTLPENISGAVLMSTGSPEPPEPQLAPTCRFICDRCGGEIEDVSTAWGQWYGCDSEAREGVERSWNFSIVHGEAHSPQCTLVTPRGLRVGDCSISFLQSADGFAYLLEFFVSREVDPAELSCFLMRLFVPGYEQAHRYISAAIADDVLETRGHRAFLTQSEISRIIEAHAEGRFNTYT